MRLSLKSTSSKSGTVPAAQAPQHVKARFVIHGPLSDVTTNVGFPAESFEKATANLQFFSRVPVKMFTSEASAVVLSRTPGHAALLSHPTRPLADMVLLR
jgi:hypothetical protein